MNAPVKIITSIFAGIENACQQSFSFYNEHFAALRPEYLVTVNVAQQLKKDFDDYMIWLEEPTEELKNSSIDIKAWELFVETIKNRTVLSRPGFVDIAVYNYDKKPVCLIELKGINIQRAVITADIARNVEFLSHNQADSLLRNSFIAFIVSDETWNFKSQMAPAIALLDSETKNWVAQHCPGNLRIEIKIQPVFNTLLDDDFDLEQFEPEDRHDEQRKGILYLGVILHIYNPSVI